MTAQRQKSDHNKARYPLVEVPDETPSQQSEKHKNRIIINISYCWEDFSRGDCSTRSYFKMMINKTRERARERETEKGEREERKERTREEEEREKERERERKREKKREKERKREKKREKRKK